MANAKTLKVDSSRFRYLQILQLFYNHILKIFLRTRGQEFRVQPREEACGDGAEEPRHHGGVAARLALARQRDVHRHRGRRGDVRLVVRCPHSGVDILTL